MADWNEFWERMSSRVVGTRSLRFGDDLCYYEIVHPSFEPRLPHFVGVVDASKHTFFISSDTPPEYRAPIIYHEHRCATHRAAGHGTYCHLAVNEEIVYAKQQGLLIDPYIEMRRQFFSNLVEFLAKSKDAEFLGQASLTRDFLSYLRP